MVNTRTGEFDWMDFWRVRGRLMRRAWREVRRSRLAAITVGVWIAVALVRAFEFVGN